MKNCILAAILLCAGSYASAQHPVEWSFYSQKINANTYEIHLVATIDKDWHVYSQHSSKKGPAPVALTIKPAAHVRLKGSVKEAGIPVKKKNVEGVRVQYFERELRFVQTVSVSGPVTEHVKGSISYVAASASKTQPVHTVDFSVMLEP